MGGAERDLNGRFLSGHEKLGGRRPGTPNKIKFLDIDAKLEKRKLDPIEYILDRLDKLSSDDKRVAVMLQLIALRDKDGGAEPNGEVDDDSIGDSLKEKSNDELIDLLPEGKHGENISPKNTP